MTLNRRKFMVGSAGVAALAGLGAGCSDDNNGGSDKPDGGGNQDGGADGGTPLSELALDTSLFEHGVASGDPSADAVILWTRVSGQKAETELRWVIANDEELKDVVGQGRIKTSADHDYTVQVDAGGLSPGGTYYYAFALGDEGRSVIGRARTLPDAGTAHVRFAFTSCANYNNGYFHAYRAIAERDDLDVWIHLGDYIYEYKDGEYGDTALTDRKLDPLHEAISLEDYRTRYAQNRKDADLQELHRRHTCIVVWDDHEVADNASLTGAVNHMPDEGDWDTRVAAGTQAFKEWIPLRLPDASDPRRIFRNFEFGKLFDLIMIDTRLYGRDAPAGGLFTPGDPAVWADPKRQLLGEKQEQFVKDMLSMSRERGATWRILGNQVMIAETKNPLSGEIANSDAWDGYQPARARIVSHIKTNGIDNVVVITGDIHTSWALDLAENPYESANYDPSTGRGSYGVELVGPSVTSTGLEDQPSLADLAPSALPPANPHLKWVDVVHKGYVLVDVQEERVQAEWYHVGDHKKKDADSRAAKLVKAYACVSGSAHLTEASGPSPAKS